MSASRDIGEVAEGAPTPASDGVAPSDGHQLPEEGGDQRGRHTGLPRYGKLDPVDPATTDPSEAQDAERTGLGESGVDGSQTYTEEEFQDHLSRAQSSRDQKISQLEKGQETISQELYQVTESNWSMQQQMQRGEQWVKKFIEDNGGDERDLAAYKMALSETEKSTARELAKGRSQTQQWLQLQQDGHQRHLNDRSKDPESGQTIFDPNDQRIAAEYDEYLSMANALARGSQGVTNESLQRKFNQLQTTIENVRDEGLRSLAGGGTQVQGAEPELAPAGATSGPQANRARAERRGVQNRGAGAPSSVSSEQLMEQAKREIEGPDTDPKVREERFFHWRDLRREHGIEG